MVKDDTEIIQSLVTEAIAGDRQAFSKLVRRYIGGVVAMLYRMTSDMETAKDLAQDVFIAAWEKRRQFRGEGNFKSWVNQIAANRALNHLKRESRNVDGEAVIEHTEDPSQSPERAYLASRARQDVLDFMQSLPEMQRLVFELRFYKEHTFDEIARLTGKALGTVKTHYREAVIKLRGFATERGWR
jgi:RNA polymerase sigma factor (sigma-70 family)